MTRSAMPTQRSVSNGNTPLLVRKPLRSILLGYAGFVGDRDVPKHDMLMRFGDAGMAGIVPVSKTAASAAMGVLRLTMVGFF